MVMGRAGYAFSLYSNTEHPLPLHPTNEGDGLSKLIYCQTVLFEEQVETLKKLSGKGSIKDALIDAVDFFIEQKGKA